MHTEHDALPVVAGNGDSSLFVAATLAALVLAGSALVYRKTFEQQSEREKLTHTSEQPTPDDMNTEKNQPLDVHRYVDGASSNSIHDPDSKESKSSRSKDRRRRGKDPLKEILKGGKKVKGTTTTPVKQLFPGQPILDDLDNIPSPSTPASSSTRNSTPNSLSRGSGKHTQPDDSLYNLTGATMHSRPTSEVSQSNTGSKIQDQPHPHQHTRDTTASFTSVSDHHVSQSSSSSHNGTEDNTSILDERNPDFLIRQTHETDPTPSIFSTIIQNNNGFSEIVNRSLPSSASSTTTSCVITPATSPSLSYTSSKLVPHVAADSEFAPNNGSGFDCGPKNNLVSPGPSHALADTTRKQQPSPNPTPSKSKSKSKTNEQNTWEWESTGEVASSSSFSASVIASAPTSSLITAPAFPPDIVYRKPPRLQPKSLWSKVAKNDASSSILGSVSHPSLLSPTLGSFAPSDSALLSPSISSSLEKVPGRVSKVAKEGEGGESEEERDTTDDSYTQLEFPTLNPTSTMLTSYGGSTTSSSAAGPSNNHRPTTPRRGHSSRGPSTPSGSTPPPPLNSGSGSSQPPSTPALSTQTQLASLRGALEAARLREEKHKTEMERYTKELETLRWENMNSKRGEVELQNHIRHLMHQLQMYSSLFASVTPQPTSQQQPLQQTQGLMADTAGLSNPGDRATSELSNGPTTSSPGTPQVQSPTIAVFPGPPVSSPRMHLHMLPPLQLNGLPSPSSLHTPSPYFPYPMPQPPLHPHSVMPAPHPLFAQQIHHMQQQFLQYQHQYHQSQNPAIQAQQGNPLTMLHHPSLANIPSYQSYVASSSSSMASGSRSSSRPGTESTGSSPDLNGSLSPGSGSKRKARTRTQIGNGYIGGRAVRKGAVDSWVVGGVGIDEGDEDEKFHEDEERGANGDGDEDDEGGFNEILADAILKRPDSIGVRSGKKNKQALLEKEMEEEKMSKDRGLEQLEDNILDAVEPLTEFKFPSLSNLGNVYDGGHKRGSSSSSSMIVSEDLEPNIFDLPASDRSSSQDIGHLEADVFQNGVVELDNDNDENQPTLETASSSPESSERTPRREESEPSITEPSMDLNEAEEEATNVPEG